LVRILYAKKIYNENKDAITKTIRIFTGELSYLEKPSINDLLKISLKLITTPVFIL